MRSFDETLREMDRLLSKQHVQERWKLTHPPAQTDWIAGVAVGGAFVLGLFAAWTVWDKLIPPAPPQ